MIPRVLAAAELVFWDFDGVVKDSVEAKSVAFERLFLPYGSELASRVRSHHEANGGMSRFEKVPLYLQWAGADVSEGSVGEVCSRFSELVFQSVVDSAWVPGVREYIEQNYRRQRFVIVTGTPTEEMVRILGLLAMRQFFSEVHGAPEAKADAVRDVLGRVGCKPDRAVLVGDSSTDLHAAQANGVSFLLRRTALNKDLQEGSEYDTFDGLNDE